MFQCRCVLVVPTEQPGVLVPPHQAAVPRGQTTNPELVKENHPQQAVPEHFDNLGEWALKNADAMGFKIKVEE